jgi:hypothetical protein
VPTWNIERDEKLDCFHSQERGAAHMRSAPPDGGNGSRELADWAWDKAVDDAEHSERVAYAWQFLRQELARQRFNTERATEVLTIAVDNAVWADLNYLREDVRRKSYAAYKARNLGPKKARELLEKFVGETGAVNQRPARRWFRSLLGA